MAAMIRLVLWPLRGGHHGSDLPRTIAGGTHRDGLRLGHRPLVQRAKANLKQTRELAQTTAQTSGKGWSGKSRAGIRATQTAARDRFPHRIPLGGSSPDDSRGLDSGGKSWTDWHRSKAQAGPKPGAEFARNDGQGLGSWSRVGKQLTGPGYGRANAGKAWAPFRGP